MNYDDHEWVLKQLHAAQEADHDNREQAREAALFVHKRDGQWEPHWWQQSDKKPRYTFDLVSPIIRQIEGVVSKSDFTVRVLPAGGDSAKDTADVYDGLVRNIEQISNADEVYDGASRSMAIKGLDGWRVVQKYANDDSFDQDLMVERIPNYVDRVWFGPHTKQDASDAKYCWLLTGMSEDEFKKRYPKRSESASLSSDRTSNAYYYRENQAFVGEFIYLKTVKRTLVLMSNGSTYEANKDFEARKDEFESAEIFEVKRRDREKRVACSRKFDANGWIDEPKETVFENWLPIVPVYANFDYYEDKVVYYGAVEKLMDPQRVFNYSLSREVEEGALAPRAKYFMTRKQAKGEEKSLRTMNTNSDPVQFFTPDDKLPGSPQQQGGAQINPGLRSLSETSQQVINQIAGMFSANMGDNPGLQSGKAILALQDRGDTGHDEYIRAREVAQRHTGRILVNAIPRVYTPGRQVRILQEDGAYDIKTIGGQVLDQETGTTAVMNDLSQGVYDVTCTSGPAFQNRQSETVSAIVEVGSVDASVIEVGSDILLKNINSPGMGDIAERKRQQLFQAGLIPINQMTDEEKQQLQQMAMQPPQESPEMVLARGEQAEGEAKLIDAQTKQAEAQATIEQNAIELKIKEFEAETKRMEAQIKLMQAKADLQGKGAKAAKDLAEAEGQDIENALVKSGVANLVALGG